jgi:group I intron endonuclease
MVAVVEWSDTTIYKLTNRITGKSYIGQTTGSVKQRLASHRYRAGKEPRGFALSSAMAKHGADSFDVQILQECTTQDELNAAEIEWIKRLRTNAPYGYNIREGGSRGTHSESTRAKLRARVVTPEWRAKISAANRGRTQTDGQRLASRERLKRHRWKVNQKGERNGRSRLTEKQIGEIRTDYEKGGCSQFELAAKFGVHQTTISHAITRRSWSSIRRP